MSGEYPRRFFVADVTAFDFADVSSCLALCLHLLVCKLEFVETIGDHVSSLS
jgi:hypothetical protein